MSHVECTGPSDVSPLQKQVGEAVQAQAGGQGADETIQPPQGHTERPAEEQEDQQPHQSPYAGGEGGHPVVLGL